AARGEAWAIRSVFPIFLLRTTSTKDFADMEGDRAHGCVTLPIRFGVERAAKIIAPFFVLPWLLIPLFAWLPDPGNPSAPLLTGSRPLLVALGVGLALWGAYAA